FYPKGCGMFYASSQHPRPGKCQNEMNRQWCRRRLVQCRDIEAGLFICQRQEFSAPQQAVLDAQCHDVAAFCAMDLSKVGQPTRVSDTSPCRGHNVILGEQNQVHRASSLKMVETVLPALIDKIATSSCRIILQGAYRNAKWRLMGAFDNSSPTFRSSAVRVIRKYANRRLYDTEQSRYVTLEDLRSLILEEVPFRVEDAKSGEDLTRTIL